MMLLLDKPYNISSQVAVTKVKRLFQEKKAGHGGTLDPRATGMLPIFFGEATKFAQFLLNSNKTYDVTAQLGATSVTGDAEGPIVPHHGRMWEGTSQQLQTLLEGLVGQQQQCPPMYSAVKYKGKPLYRWAREGKEVLRSSRQIEIFSMQLLHFKDRESFTFRMRCSKGTYVRTVVEQCGTLLGCGAYVQHLRRVQVGPYSECQMVSWPVLEEIGQGKVALQSYLWPVESVLDHWPRVILSSEESTRVQQGQQIVWDKQQLDESGHVRLVRRDPECFLGIGYLKNGLLSPQRLLSATALGDKE